MTFKVTDRMMRFIDLVIQENAPDAQPLTAEERAFVREYRAEVLARALARGSQAQD